MKKLQYHSLIVKISLIILLIEPVIFISIGIYYTNRFSREIDKRIELQVQLPGLLMNHQLLRYHAVSDGDMMTELVGDEFVAGWVIGTDNKVYYALNARHVGKAILDVSGFDPRWIDIQATGTRILRLSATHDTFLVSATPLTAYEGAEPFFYVYIKVKTNQAERNKAIVARLFVFGSLFSVGLTSLLLIWFMQRIITRPLRRLEDTVRQITQGDLNQTISLSRQDEIGRLAKSFTYMRDAIRQKIFELEELNQTLEQKVEERTQELEKNVVLLQQEIAERKQAEHALRESENRYRRLIERSPDVVYMYSNQHGGIYYSPQAARLFGCSLEYLYEHPTLWPQSIHPDDLAGVTEAIRQFSTGQPFRIEYRVQDRQGNWHWLLDRSIGGRQEGNELLIEGLASDITERKRAEEEVHRLNTQLETRVKQRTAELEAANKELRSFAYIVSHDLKAPLRGISQLASWIALDYASVFDEQGYKWLTLLQNRVHRMDELLDGILRYSRIGRAEKETMPVNLNILVQKVIDSLAPPDHIRIQVPDNLPTIPSDPIRVQQVFQNLIGNALKFMDKPDGQVTLGCQNNGTHFTFSVADNGPGIDPKYHERIFQVFQILTPRDTRESTGIGLSIVKKIVEELYGGRIWLESAAGQGSTFYFTLPAIEPE